MGAETLNWRGILCILGVLSEVFSSLVRVMPRILGVLSEVFSSLLRTHTWKLSESELKANGELS